MKKLFRIFLVISVFILCALALSGCGHYKRGEAAEWFRENIADMTVAVSKDYTETEDDDGNPCRVWSAHLKGFPQVEFELISYVTYGLFPDYSLKTTYYTEMGDYYLDEYKREYPGALNGFEFTESGYQDTINIVGIYDEIDEIEDMCDRFSHLSEYLSEQPYPVSVTYSLAYREPLTFTYTGADPYVEYAYRDTYVWETAAFKSPVQEAPAAEDLYLMTDVMETEEALRTKAEERFAEYAVTYRLEMDQFTEEQLESAVDYDAEYRFMITRPDGKELCYPDLTLRYSDSMTFGCLYEVLMREGTYDVSGTPEAFTFTAADGAECTFSYTYRLPASDRSVYGERADNDEFYYFRDMEVCLLSEEPFIDSELFKELTGCDFQMLSGT